MTIRWEAAGGTDIGRVRRANEDAFLVDESRGIFVVADGMGGHAAGEVASAIATEVVGRGLAREVERGASAEEIENAFLTAIADARAEIRRFAVEHPDARGLGTTLTACVVTRGGEVLIGHIGDSRAYRLRDGTLRQITTDHTWVQAQVDAGRLTPEAARRHPLAHVITRALGEDPGDAAEVHHGTAASGDVLLLCSDGLTGMVEDGAIAPILSSSAPLAERAMRLLEAANEAGGTDNVTVVLVRIA